MIESHSQRRWRDRGVWLPAVLLVLLSLAQAARAAQPALTSDDVRKLIPHVLNLHLLRPTLDGEHVQRLVKNYMDQLDPTHTLYLKEEAEQKLKAGADERAKLGEQIKAGKLDYFVEWTEDFRKRVLTRDAEFTNKLAERKAEILPKPKKDDGDKLKFKEYPASEEARRARIIYIASNDYHFFKEYLSEEEAFRFALQTIQKLREKWAKLDPQAETPKLVMKALLLSLDPHSEYMDEEDVEQFENNMQRSFAGIGVQIRGCPSGAQVIEVIEGGPASKSGQFDAYDQIIAVDDAIVAGQGINQIVKKIKGEKGTPVKLTLRKAAKDGGVQRVENITLVRDTIDLTEIRVKGKTYETPAGPVGFVSVANFYHGVSGDVAERIRQLGQKTPLAGLILDLRGNSGGLLEEAVKLAGLFISEGPIVAEQDAFGRVRWRNDPDDAIVFSRPLVILVNQFSASASEIVTGALRDYGRAIVAGPTQTHGKGSVQRVIDLDNVNLPGRLKITFQQYFLAGGESVQLKGVEPDLVIPGMKLIEDFLERKYDAPIPWAKIPGRIDPEHPDFKKYTAFKTGILAKLKENSAKRVAANKDFERFRQPDAETPDKEPQDPEPKRDPKTGKRNEKDPQAEEAAQIVSDMAVAWVAAEKK